MDRKRRATWWGLSSTALIIASAIVFGLTCLGQLNVRNRRVGGGFFSVSSSLGAFHVGYQRNMLLSGVPFSSKVFDMSVWKWGPGPYTSGAFVPSYLQTSIGFEITIPAVFIWAPLGIAAVLARKKQRRLANPTLCERCGYVIIGVAKCAECGTAITPG
jgi:hypothetical protein